MLLFQKSANMNGRNFLSFIMVYLFFVKADDQNDANLPPENAVYKKIFANYNKELRPNIRSSKAVNVTMDLVLYSIEDTDELHQSVSFNIWYHVEWREDKFSWKPYDYDGITDIEVSPKAIWMPDIYLKGVQKVEIIPDKDTTLCDVYSHGVVHCEFNQLLTAHCDYSIARFPYDTQNCSFEFGSWKYGMSELNLHTNSSGANIKFFKSSNEWDLISFKNKRIVKASSRESFAKIFYFLIIKRKPLHYVMTMILPSFLICMLSLLGLFTPFSSFGERQERITMGMTMLLTMSVLLLVVSEQMPQTSSGMPPLLGLYILFEFFLGAVGTFVTAIIMHLHQKALRGKKPPERLCELLGVKQVKINDATLHENKAYERGKRSNSSKNSVVNNDEIEVISDRDLIGPNILQMVKVLKSCFAHLETLSDFVEKKKTEDGFNESWRIVCDKLDTICMTVLLTFNLLFTIIVLVAFELTE